MKRDLFWKLLEPEHRKAEAFCRKIAGNGQDGDDLYQDSLLAALRKFESLQKTDSFRPWLYRIIVNRFKSRTRSPWFRRRESLEDTPSLALPVYDPSDTYTARRWLERALKPLSPSDRVLITLFEIEGWSVGELSGILGKPEGTIKSRLSRARTKMKKEISRYLSREKMENQAEGGRICVAGRQNVD